MRSGHPGCEAESCHSRVPTLAMPAGGRERRLQAAASLDRATGSLAVSVTDMRAPLVGGSGGVYALCSAHLANVVMRVRDAVPCHCVVSGLSDQHTDKRAFRQELSAADLRLSSEVGRAVWLRFSPPLPSAGPQPSFMAHLAGAAVGVSMGLTILRSYEENLQDQCGWWVILLCYATFLAFAIFWNVFAYDLLGVQIPHPP
ncbi:hypothetical protein AB205_0014700 [Aquarana catesbeiana]|uniref:rhomboid protease n=1 Tax=Aquarana catesbeiana TaxID=8400 RepID=A0A2G9RF63_AQUCT|nr:hypothetical protein AB205_0014700 [Aquarana catesbeiana]